jgi:NADPH:quinone reductase-like Zn-dependent oxidoreductase
MGGGRGRASTAHRLFFIPTIRLPSSPSAHTAHPPKPTHPATHARLPQTTHKTQTMKAVQYSTFGPSSVLSVVDVDRPAPKPGQAVVRVCAASLNPIDWKVRVFCVWGGGGRRECLPPEEKSRRNATDLLPFARAPRHAAQPTPLPTPSPPHPQPPINNQIRSGIIPRPIARLPATPAADVAGVIEAPAPGGRFKKGDRVFGIMSAWGAPGALAEFALVPETSLAPLPDTMTFEQGASLPLALLTAWQALDAGRVGAGQKVLVTAAAGGVGSFAVPLAAARGADVAGTCSPRNATYLTGRGASSAIDYNTTDVGEASPDAYDVVVDMVGGKTEDASYKATKSKGGRFVSIMNSGTSLPKVAGRTLRGGLGLGPKYSFVVLNAKNCSARLEEATGMVAAGKLPLPEIKVFNGLEAAGDAMDELEAGHVRGKVVVKVAE